MGREWLLMQPLIATYTRGRWLRSFSLRRHWCCKPCGLPSRIATPRARRAMNRARKPLAPSEARCFCCSARLSLYQCAANPRRGRPRRWRVPALGGWRLSAWPRPRSAARPRPRQGPPPTWPQGRAAPPAPPTAAFCCPRRPRRPPPQPAAARRVHAMLVPPQGRSALINDLINYLRARLSGVLHGAGRLPVAFGSLTAADRDMVEEACHPSQSRVGVRVMAIVIAIVIAILSPPHTMLSVFTFTFPRVAVVPAATSTMQ